MKQFAYIVTILMAFVVVGIAIADDSSDPLHNRIMRSVHNLTEVQ